MANGRKHLSYVSSSATAIIENVMCDFSLEILNGSIRLELRGPLSIWENDDLIRIGKRIIGTTVSGLVMENGIGLTFTIESLLRPPSLFPASVDQAPIASKHVSWSDCLTVSGIFDQFDWALRDFNTGLIDRENCPFFFYRCIESLALAVSKEEEIGKGAWEKFHAALGTSRSEFPTIMKFGKKHRHGTRLVFKANDHLEMMREVRNILTWTHAYLLPLAEEQLKKHKEEIALIGK